MCTGTQPDAVHHLTRRRPTTEPPTERRDRQGPARAEPGPRRHRRPATGSLAQTGTDLLLPRRPRPGCSCVVGGARCLGARRAAGGRTPDAWLRTRPPARLAGAAAASGLALAGLVVAAAPASAAACSGTSGVTVVVDTGSSISTRCASGDPSSALKALTAAGFSVTYPQQFPGSVVCRINGYPASDPCVRMPPARRLLGVLPRQARRQLDLQLERGRELQPRRRAPSSGSASAPASSRASPRRPPTKTSEPAPTKTTTKPKRPRRRPSRRPRGRAAATSERPRRRRGDRAGTGPGRHGQPFGHGVTLESTSPTASASASPHGERRRTSPSVDAPATRDRARRGTDGRGRRRLGRRGHAWSPGPPSWPSSAGGAGWTRLEATSLTR